MLRDYCACGYCGTRRKKPRVNVESVSDARRRTNRDNRYSRRNRIVEEHDIDANHYCIDTHDCEAFLSEPCLSISRRECTMEAYHDRGEFD